MNTQPLKSITKSLLIPAASIVLLLLYYPTLSFWLGGVGFGWGKGRLGDIKIELALVTAVYYCFFFILRKNIFRHLLALLPIIFFFGFIDYFFISLGKVFKICDISEIPELVDVLPFWQLAVYITLILHVLFVIAWNLTRVWQRYLLPLTFLVIIFLCTSVNPRLYLDIFNQYAKFGVTQWSDQNTAQNGYFTTLLFFEAMMENSKVAANEMFTDAQNTDYEKSQAEITQFLSKKNNAHNVHVIILESFFNPALFAKVSFSAPVYDKKFMQLLQNKENGITSPVFGGNTAEAEFEVLCGVPAAHKYSSIEFNSFTNASVSCLPKILKDSGYQVIASNAYKPNFFNETNAYKGIGFDKMYFPRQYAPKSDTYLSLVDQSKYLFDGDLFEQNLAFLKQQLDVKERKPIFNYVLGIYGHLPFTLDEKRHPLKIKASSKGKAMDAEFNNASNQIYYRTGALADYLTKLIELDPKSIIIVMGDHVPALAGIPFYKKMGYRQKSLDGIHEPPAFFIYNGKFVKKEGLHQYNMMNMIFDYITDDTYCKTHACNKSQDELLEQYHMVMARALR